MDAGRHGLREAEGASDGEHPVPYLHALASRSCAGNPREPSILITAMPRADRSRSRGRVTPALLDAHLDLRRTLDDVVVRDDVPLGSTITPSQAPARELVGQVGVAVRRGEVEQIISGSRSRGFCCCCGGCCCCCCPRRLLRPGSPQTSSVLILTTAGSTRLRPPRTPGKSQRRASDDRFPVVLDPELTVARTDGSDAVRDQRADADPEREDEKAP